MLYINIKSMKFTPICSLNFDIHSHLRVSCQLTADWRVPANSRVWWYNLLLDVSLYNIDCINTADTLYTIAYQMSCYYTNKDLCGGRYMVLGTWENWYWLMMKSEVITTSPWSPKLYLSTDTQVFNCYIIYLAQSSC